VRLQYFLTMGPTEVFVVDDALVTPVVEHDTSTNVPISCSRKISLSNSKQRQHTMHYMPQYANVPGVEFERGKICGTKRRHQIKAEAFDIF